MKLFLITIQLGSRPQVRIELSIRVTKFVLYLLLKPSSNIYDICSFYAIKVIRI